MESSSSGFGRKDGAVIELSDHGALMEKFLALPCPRMFMYGSQNASLSHLKRIEAHGVELPEIPDCGHFPMYSNPVAMWAQIGAFYDLHFDRGRRRALPASRWRRWAAEARRTA